MISDPDASVSPREINEETVNYSVLSTPQERSSTYDFTPILTASAVQEKVRENLATLPLLSPIPTTRIPSPLASNLSPAVIEDIHDYLLSVGVYSNQNAQAYNGNNREIWESWKRAWDIWNNHFIEGRVNEVWIGQTYRKYEAWEKYRTRVRRSGRRLKETPKTGPYRTEEIALADLKEQLQGHHSEGFINRSIQELTNCFESFREFGPKYVEFCEALVRHNRLVHSMPQIQDYENNLERYGEGYLPLTRDRALADEEERHGVEWRQKLEEILDQITHRDPGHIEYAVALNDFLRQPEIKGFTAEKVPKYDDFVTFASSERARLLSVEPWERETLRERFRANRHLGVGYIELSLAQVNHAALTDGMTESINPPPPNPDDYIGKVHPGPVPYPDPGSGTDTDYASDPDDLSRVEKPPIVEEDGSSGGFFAMRDFEEYTTPDDGNNLTNEYHDPIENSVWRPRTVSEESLKIDMDEEMHEFLANTDLVFDGGVDCGRSPYPLLRPLIRYARGVTRVEKQQDLKYFLKLKKTWDGVRGTIFNMPTGLPEPSLHVDELDPALGDDEMDVDESYTNHAVFPLDIRRVTKIQSELEQTPILQEEHDNLERDKDIIIEPSFKRKQKDYREILPDDPWWVTDQEREARDVPPRTYPLAVDPKQSRLPFDDKLWQDEVEKDSSYKNQYFAVNLDGRHLMINGLQIKKGQFAGPLPQFAIIQFEGGGVAFWFGVGGRSYKQADQTKDWTAEWNELRHKKPEWANIGLRAGLVWRRIILAKIREDDEAEGQQDPMWLRWKNLRPETVTAGRSPDRRHSFSILAGAGAGAGAGGGGENNHDYGSVPGPLPFKSLEEELKWVAAQFHFQQLAELPLNMSPMIEPTEETAWGGPPNGYQAPSDNPTDEQRDQIWQIHRDELLKNQTEVIGAYTWDGEYTQQSWQAFAKQVPISQTETAQAYNRVAQQQPATPMAEDTAKKRSGSEDSFDIPAAKRTQEYRETMERLRMKLIESDQAERRRKNDRFYSIPNFPRNERVDSDRLSSSAGHVTVRQGDQLPEQGFGGPNGISGEAWLRKMAGNTRDLDKQELIDRNLARQGEIDSRFKHLRAARRKKLAQTADRRKQGSNASKHTVKPKQPEQPQPPPPPARTEISLRRQEIEKNFGAQRVALAATISARRDVARTRQALQTLLETPNASATAKIRAQADLTKARLNQNKADSAYAIALSNSQRAKAWNLSASAIKSYFTPSIADESALERAIQKEADARKNESLAHTCNAAQMEDEFFQSEGFRDWEEAIERLPVATVVADVSATHGLPGTDRFRRGYWYTHPTGEVLLSVDL